MLFLLSLVMVPQYDSCESHPIIQNMCAILASFSIHIIYEKVVQKANSSLQSTEYRVDTDYDHL